MDALAHAARAALAVAVAVGLLAACPSPASAMGDAQLLTAGATTAPLVPVAPAPRPAPPTPPFTGRAYALGDSVMLGARDNLIALNYRVDAKGSRFAFMGYDVLKAALPTLPRMVVVHMGTNYGLTRTQFDAYMRLLGPHRTVVWVTVQLRNDYTRYTFEDRTNTVIRDGVMRWSNSRLVDWNQASESHRTTWLLSDGIHLTFAGRVAYARLINAVVRA